MTNQATCSHVDHIEIGATSEGLGTVVLEWCPECGALKRTMINWKYTNWPWRHPRKRANTQAEP